MNDRHELWMNGGVPGEPGLPQEPGVPDQPLEPGIPTEPDQAPPIPVA